MSPEDPNEPEERNREALVDAALLPPIIAPACSALLVVDVQQDFVGPRGAAAGWGANLELFDAPLRNIEALTETARLRDVKLIFARVVTRPETDSAALLAFHRHKGHAPDAVAVCRAGTAGAEYYRVKPRAGEIEIEKTLYSCFSGTDLDRQLRARGIDTLVVTGFTTDCCVDSTVRDAFHRGYNVVVVTDACAAYETDLHRGSLNALSRNCALLTDSEAVLNAWS
jgi:nicotinamidase-related amidase